MRLAILLASAVTLSACGPANPLVSQFNGDSVSIVVDPFTTDADVASDAKAASICKTRGKKAERGSIKSLPDYRVEILYMCL